MGLDAVAAEVIKASFAAVALEVAEPYLDGMDDLISQLAGDFGGYFFGRGLSSADALDLDMALVISGSDSGSETYAGTCGGVTEFEYESVASEYSGYDEAIGYGDEYYVNDESPLLNGTASFNGEMDFYIDQGFDTPEVDGGYYFRVSGSAEMAGDITVAATGFNGRYQFDASTTSGLLDDDRGETRTVSQQNTNAMNERFTINGSVIETTESYSYSYNGESSSSSEQDLMAYDGSVFLLDYADAWMEIKK